MTDLTPYLNSLDMLNETTKQIIKDFGLLGMKIKFSGNGDVAYQELFSQILPLIEQLQKEQEVEIDFEIARGLLLASDAEHLIDQEEEEEEE